MYLCKQTAARCTHAYITTKLSISIHINIYCNGQFRPVSHSRPTNLFTIIKLSNKLYLRQVNYMNNLSVKI